jgi:hypothetical protein
MPYSFYRTFVLYKCIILKEHKYNVLLKTTQGLKGFTLVNDEVLYCQVLNNSPWFYKVLSYKYFRSNYVILFKV